MPQYERTSVPRARFEQIRAEAMTIGRFFNPFVAKTELCASQTPIRGMKLRLLFVPLFFFRLTPCYDQTPKKELPVTFVTI